MTRDKKVIQCNYGVGTSVAREGARAYVVLPNPGNGHDRIKLLVRSRGGRWVGKWESLSRLKNFRVKTLVSESPLWNRGLLEADSPYAQQLLEKAEEECRTMTDH